MLSIQIKHHISHIIIHTNQTYVFNTSLSFISHINHSILSINQQIYIIIKSKTCKLSIIYYRRQSPKETLLRQVAPSLEHTRIQFQMTPNIKFLIINATVECPMISIGVQRFKPLKFIVVGQHLMPQTFRAHYQVRTKQSLGST